MKKLLLSLIGLAISFSLFSQAPSSFNYQAVARNASGDILANASVSLKISILQGSSSGSAVFSETHSKSTNDFGLLNIEIGHGSAALGTIAGIDWAAHRHFLKIEMDPGGGQNYSYLGSSELLSVPYALHAKTVESDEVNDADADPVNEIQTLSLDGNELTLSKEGGTVTLSGGGGGDNWGSQIVLTGATLEGEGTETTPLKIAQQGAVSGQVLKWTGSSWLPGNDNSGSSIWQQSGSNIYYDGDRIGIGIEDPEHSIHVHSSEDRVGLQLSNSYTGAYNNSGLVLKYFQNAAGDSYGGLINWESSTLKIGTNSSWQMHITPQGNIGFGQLHDSPDATVDIDGEIKIRGGNPGVGKVLTSDANGLASWVTPSGGGSSGWTIDGDNMYSNVSGFVGIDIANPARQLHINDSDASSTTVLLTNSLSGVNYNDGLTIALNYDYGYAQHHAYFVNSETGPLSIGTSGNIYMKMSSNGNLGLGVDNPSTKLDVDGQVKIRGGSPGDGKVLTSDATGLASWVTPSGGESFWEQTGSNIHYTGGYVGIGIGAATPSSTLDINGQITLRGGSPGAGKVLTSDADGTGSWQTPGGGGSTLWDQSGDNIYYNSGLVGIGTDNPGSDLHLHSNTSRTSLQITNSSSGIAYGDGLKLSSGSTQAYMINLEANPLILGTNNTGDIYINANGNVGVGVMTAASKLDIDGQVKIRGGSPGSGKVLTSDASGLASWQTPSGGGDDGDWKIAGNDIYLSKPGNVGVGNTSPSYKLDVKGDRIKIANDGGDWLAMRADGSSGILDITYSDGLLAIQGSADNNDIVLNPSKNSKVGIRMWAPSYTLDVNGDIRATGSVYYGGSVGSANGTAYIKPDFVFTEDYNVLSTEEVEKFVKRKNHLPWLTSAKKEEKEHKDVINLTRMQFESLETIENLQLQLIELNNKIKELDKIVVKQQQEIDKLHAKK